MHLRSHPRGAGEGPGSCFEVIPFNGLQKLFDGPLLFCGSVLGDPWKLLDLSGVVLQGRILLFSIACCCPWMPLPGFEENRPAVLVSSFSLRYPFFAFGASGSSPPSSASMQKELLFEPSPWSRSAFCTQGCSPVSWFFLENNDGRLRQGNKRAR